MRPPYPSDAAPHYFDSPPERSIFDRLGLAGFGMALFMFSLSVLFIAGLIGYFAKWLSHPAASTGTIPPVLWVSTAVLGVSAVTMLQAQRAARAGRLRSVTHWLTATTALSLAFLAVQTPAMVALIDAHRAQSFGLNGPMFFLIVLHAAHVVGGIVPLFYLSVRFRGPASSLPEPQAVQFTGVYWHFLEIVWLVLLAAFLITG